MDAGDIYLTDMGGESPVPALVLSNRELHRQTDRAIVAPAWPGADVTVQYPWIVEGEDDVEFAVHRVRSVDVDRLLRRTGRAPYRTTWLAQRALMAITVG
jgi:mRNA-degrading endonuclease toxin of MazEF toxin-antitoxin module